MIEIRAIGGYNEVGKNMTAIRIDDEVIICDMGIHLENYIKLTEDEDIVKVSAHDLMRVGAVPDIKKIDDWKSMVKAVIPTHAHLDHIGAIPFLINEYNADIICTPFTAEVIKAIIEDEEIRVHNRIRTLHPNSHLKLGKDITIEFINVTHSTPQTVILAIHTKYGTIIYANDFKFDLYPVLGKSPDFERLQKLDKVIALIVDSTYSNDERKMPSESVARQMLKDILLGTHSKGKAVVITTFSSHLARLKSIIDFSKRMDRKIVFLGRSLSKYVKAGENTNIINFSKDVEIVSFRKKINKKLKEITEKGKEKYVLVVTGHQGEPKAVLSRMAHGLTNFKFSSEDFVIFSCKTIPTETNIYNRTVLEDALKKHGVRLFKDIHVSGHSAKEDLKDMLLLVKPKNVIPAHGDRKMREGMAEICREMKLKETQIHLLKDGDKITFN